METRVLAQEYPETTSVTYIFKEVEQGRLEQEQVEYSKLSDVISKNSKIVKGVDKIHFATNSDNTFCDNSNGLMDSIIRAYSKHIPLRLKPDDLWIAIATSFGKYVCNHAEEMRSCFVDHTGTKELTVRMNTPPMEDLTEDYWGLLMEMMYWEINENTKEDVAKWMNPVFSTTTLRDRLVSVATLMGAMQKYFAYGFELGCGLSEVTLEGRLEDWEKLVENAKGLYRYKQDELTRWADLLIPVLEQFVSLYKGEPDEDFWQRICTNKRRGSGSQQYYKGWFLVFTPFDSDGKYILRSKEQVEADHVYGVVDDDAIADCITYFPVKIIDNNVGKVYETTFFSGLIMTAYDEESNILSPTSDWGIVVKKDVQLSDMNGVVEKYIREIESTVDDACQKIANIAVLVGDLTLDYAGLALDYAGLAWSVLKKPDGYGSEKSFGVWDYGQKLKKKYPHIEVLQKLNFWHIPEAEDTEMVIKFKHELKRGFTQQIETYHKNLQLLTKFGKYVCERYGVANTSLLKFTEMVIIRYGKESDNNRLVEFLNYWQGLETKYYWGGDKPDFIGLNFDDEFASIVRDYLNLL